MRPTPHVYHARCRGARGLLPGLACLLLLVLAACRPTPPSRDGDDAAGQAPGSGTPNPPFQGEAPKEAQKHEVTGRYGGQIVLPSASNPKTFNPILANETTSTDILHGVVFRSLIDYDHEKAEVVPGLLARWSHSDDYKSWTFTLREGLRWSDGKPMGSDDLMFTYQAVVDPKVPTALKSGLVDDQGGYPRIQKVDDLSVRFDLDQPNVQLWLYVGQIYPMPKHVAGPLYEAGKFTSDAYPVTAPPAELVSSGPYRVKQYAPDQKVVLERNPHFYGVDREGNRLPYIDRVTFAISPDFNTSLLKFLNGEVDTLEPYVYPKDYARVKKGEEAGGYKVYEVGVAYNSNFWWVNQNPDKGPDGKPYVEPRKLRWFRDPVFRQALSHATNREGMVRTICVGLGQPLYGLVTAANKKWHNPDLQRYPYDLDRARAILDQLGFRDKDGDGMREDPDGKPFSFVLHTNASNQDRVAALSILVDDLGKIGLKVTSDPVDFNALIDKIRHTYDYDGAVLGLSSGVPPLPMNGSNFYLSSGISHYWHPNQTGKPGYEWEARIDELMKAIDRTDVYTEQHRLFEEVQAILAREAPVFTTYVYNHYVAAKAKIKNIKPSALRPCSYWNVEELYID